MVLYLIIRPNAVEYNTLSLLAMADSNSDRLGRGKEVGMGTRGAYGQVSSGPAGVGWLSQVPGTSLPMEAPSSS